MLPKWLERVLHRPRAKQLDVSWITPEWGVGAAPAPDLLMAVRAAGFDSVLDLRAETCPDRALYAGRGLRLRHIPVTDRHPPSQAELYDAVGWVLDEVANGRKVLLCCHAGRGRSVTVACALLVAMGYPLSRTLYHVTRRRPVASPTDQQVAALREYAAGLAEARAPARG